MIGGGGMPDVPPVLPVLMCTMLMYPYCVI